MNGKGTIRSLHTSLLGLDGLLLRR